MDPSEFFPPWVVMDNTVILATELPAIDEEHEWAEIRCASRKAYECGAHGQNLLDGLTLLARLVHNPDLTTALCIHVDAQACQIIRAELGWDDDEPIFQSTRYGNVDLVDGNLVVLTLPLSYMPELAYYLIYDAAGESLSMLPHMHTYNARRLTVKPVPVRQRGEYGLLLVAKVLRQRTTFEQRRRVFDDDALCMLHPAAAAPSADDDDDMEEEYSHIAPWRRKQRCVVSGEGSTHAFWAHVVFSFQGRAFWADLAQGVLHCNIPLATGGHSDHVDLEFIALPPGYRVDYHPQMLPIEMLRTIAAVGDDAIKFVCIDDTGDDIGARTVAVWSLQLDRKRWTRDVAFSVRSLWELEGFKRAGLPETEPKCPALTHDGALCLLLPNLRKRMEDSLADYICSVDMNSMTVLWSGRLDKYNTTWPILLPSNFLKALQPLLPLRSSCEI